MKTVRLLIYRDLAISIAYVCLGFLALFLFFDLVDELSARRPQTYQLLQAFLVVLLLIPGHLYELLPIGVLIGGVMVMAKFAQSSEFTILRTSGLGPQLALKTLLTIGAAFALLTFVIGDYIAPVANQAGQLLKARYQSSGGSNPASAALTTGQTGAWLKEKQSQHHYAVNVAGMSNNDQGQAQMAQIRIYEFDTHNVITAITEAQSAQFADAAWQLVNVTRSEFLQEKMRVQRLPELLWPTDMTAPMIAAALLKPERMSTLDLFRYSRHLDDNGQTSQIYEIEFWKKLFYPLSCLVMMMLALPFAYLHFRQGSISGYVFIGVITGISFFLLNNVFGYIGHISNWQPWLAAAAPSLLYFSLSLAAFAWVVLKK